MNTPGSPEWRYTTDVGAEVNTTSSVNCNYQEKCVKKWKRDYEKRLRKKKATNIGSFVEHKKWTITDIKYNCDCMFWDKPCIKLKEHN